MKAKRKNDTTSKLVDLDPPHLWIGIVTLEGAAIGIALMLLLVSMWSVLLHNAPEFVTVFPGELEGLLDSVNLVVYGGIAGAVFSCFGGIFYLLLLVLIRYTPFSPLNRADDYRRFSNILTLILVCAACGILLVTFTFMLIDLIELNLFSISVLAWSIFAIIFIGWRMLRFHRRFIRFYFGQKSAKNA